MPWDFALILLVLGVFVPWRGAVRLKQILTRPRLGTADRLGLYGSTLAFQWLAVGVVAWRSHVRGVTLQRLGVAFPAPELTIVTALALSLLLVANQFYSLRRLARLSPERQGFLHHMARNIMPQNQVETLAFVALVATVAVCEEFLYRGFVLSVIRDAAKDSLPIAAVAASALFALAHLYQGRRGLASTFLVGLIFAAARIATESLAPSIFAHFLADLVAGLYAPRMLSPPPVATPAQPPAPLPSADPPEDI
jgi:membrane protease YdiL (CAAX protease family)